MILQDDDRTSPQGKDGWRRLNTLGHYGVAGQAIMALVNKNKQVFTYNSDNYSEFFCFYHSGVSLLVLINLTD